MAGRPAAAVHPAASGSCCTVPCQARSSTARWCLARHCLHRSAAHDAPCYKQGTARSPAPGSARHTVLRTGYPQLTCTRQRTTHSASCRLRSASARASLLEPRSSTCRGNQKSWVLVRRTRLLSCWGCSRCCSMQCQFSNLHPHATSAHTCTPGSPWQCCRAAGMHAIFHSDSCQAHNQRL